MSESVRKNLRVRLAIKEKGITYKALAAHLGISSENFSRLLSMFELADSEQDKMINAIDSMLIDQNVSNRGVFINRKTWMKKKNNIYIRKSLEKTGVRLYELADGLGISEPSMYRRLRKELPMEEQEKYVNVIYRIRRTKEETA